MKVTIVMGFFLPVPALAGGATEKIWPRLGELMACSPRCAPPLPRPA